MRHARYCPPVMFRVSQRALEQLEWPRVIEQLGHHLRTPGARRRVLASCDDPNQDPLFAGSHEDASERLGLTDEARAILDQNDFPPLGGTQDLEPAFRRLEKGGVLAAREFRDLAALLTAIRTTHAFLNQRADVAPKLIDVAAGLGDHGDLEEDIEYQIDPDAEIRDEASSALATARRDARRHASDLKRRVENCLRDPQITPHLSDSFFTLRNDRYVLPVRADSRSSVPGIVHGASGSGTTVFIEPQRLVDLNNALKHAELLIERETLRILRELSQAAASALPAIRASLTTLEEIDLAFGRGALSREMNAVTPVVADAGVLNLPGLRHPLIPAHEVVPNDLVLGEDYRVLVLSGPNAGGKTVALKAAALAVLLVRAGFHVPADPGARVDRFDAVLVQIGDEQDIRTSLSTFSAHMSNVAKIVDSAGPRTLVVLDEIGDGTDPGEGASLAQAILEALAEAEARVVTTTHFNLLKEMAAVDPRFANASAEFDPDTLEPTFRLRLGVPGASAAAAVAARMGLREDILARARSLLEREDRRLEQLLNELSSSRAQLERERAEAMTLRAESESVRARYSEKLTALQERRDKLFRQMREDLDRSFRDAHGQVAAVIRDLQRGGDAQAAAHARKRLLALEVATPDPPEPEAARDADFEAMDWERAKPGQPVRLRAGGPAVLLALPDKRGRVALQVGSARLTVTADQVGLGSAAPTPRPKREYSASLDATASEENVYDANARTDLRGMRVEEALDRVIFALDRAAARGSGRLVFIHGIGTGALRDAVRRHLRDSAYVSKFMPGDPSEGGEGVTIAEL